MQQHPHMFLPSVVLLWFDKQVDSSMAADTHYFLLSPSVRLICTSSLRWPPAIFLTECFLSVMTEDKRGLNIRSISMDFRFESPGERWALWKDSERATKGKTSKHQRKKKINSIWFMVQRLCLFSGYTYNHFCQHKHCNMFLWCHLCLQVMTQTQNFISRPPPPLMRSKYSISFLCMKLDHSTISFFNFEYFFTFGLLLIQYA